MPDTDPHMTPVDYNPFHGALVWHRFDQQMTDAEIEAALSTVGVTAVLIDRDQQVVFVDKDNSFTSAIQNVLNNWTP